jgi:threonine dehydratase
MTHVGLLGDSVFDNGAYVNGGHDVVTHLRQLVPPHSRASLLAKDGAMIDDIARQLTTLLRDATHLVVSVGGNDLLAEVRVLTTQVRTVADALVRLSSIREAFSHHYRTMLERVLQKEIPTAVTTIYDGAADCERQQRVNSTAVAVINDAITREAMRHRLPVIELREVCTEPLDYANPIEPSDQGGAKIARAIAEFVMGKGGCWSGAESPPPSLLAQ